MIPKSSLPNCAKALSRFATLSRAIYRSFSILRTVVLLALGVSLNQPICLAEDQFELISRIDLKTPEGRKLEPVMSILFSPDERAIFTSHGSDSIWCWDVKTGKAIRQIGGIPAFRLQWSRDGKTLLCLHSGNFKRERMLSTIDPEGGRIIKNISWDLGFAFHELSFCPNTKQLIAVEDKEIRLFDYLTENEAKVPSHLGKAAGRGHCFCPNLPWLFLTSHDHHHLSLVHYETGSLGL